MASTATSYNPSREDFAAMLDESFGSGNLQEGSVIKGNVVAIEKDMAVIDVGLKTEGRVALREFAGPGRERRTQGRRRRSRSISTASRTRSARPCCRATRRAAKRAGASSRRRSRTTRRSHGVIFNQVKGGFTVDLDGAVAFLPRSQVDIRPIRDVGPLMNNPQPFQILKMDRRRGNIVVSRRTVLEETRAEQRQELVQNLEEGQVIDGVVKNITDYGAFVDLGGIDGLLHVTDIAWRRVNHPTEVLTIGQTGEGQDHQDQPRDPPHLARHEAAARRSVAGHRGEVSGRRPLQRPRHQHHRLRRLRRTRAGHRRPDPRLRNVVDQEEHASRQDRLDLAGGRGAGARSRSGQAPHFARSQADHAQSVGSVRREVSGRLDGRRRGQEQDRVRPVPRPRRRRRRHGAPVRPRLEASGRAGHRQLQEGRHGQGQVLDVDVEKERISLGIKQLDGDPFAEPGDVKKGAVVTCEVLDVKEGGIDVQIVGTDFTTFIKRSELARDRPSSGRALRGRREGRCPRHPVRQARPARSQVSIKALEVAEEKEAIAQYGSSDSGATLGDILGTALKQRSDK